MHKSGEILGLSNYIKNRSIGLTLRNDLYVMFKSNVSPSNWIQPWSVLFELLISKISQSSQKNVLSPGLWRSAIFGRDPGAWLREGQLLRGESDFEILVFCAKTFMIDHCVLCALVNSTIDNLNKSVDLKFSMVSENQFSAKDQTVVLFCFLPKICIVSILKSSAQK